MNVLNTTLAPVAASVGAGRRAVAAELADRGVAPELVDVVELLVSELLTNALLHADTDLDLRTSLERGHIRVEVADGSPGRPILRHPPADATSGRGLEIVDALASRWGVDERPGGGKSVWFEVSC